jgi:hypothetical protein
MLIYLAGLRAFVDVLEGLMLSVFYSVIAFGLLYRCVFTTLSHPLLFK